MKKYPDDAKYRDKHIESVTSTLPVASWAQCRHLQHHLQFMHMQNVILWHNM